MAQAHIKDQPRPTPQEKPMRTRTLMFAAVALLAAPIVVQAQGASTTNPSATRREQAMERREAARDRRGEVKERRAAMTPEQRETARARRADRVNAMPAEQVQFRTDLRAYQRGLREKSTDLRAQVKAGTLTRDDMATQLKAYRDASRPRNPAPARPAPVKPAPVTP